LTVSKKKIQKKNSLSFVSCSSSSAAAAAAAGSAKNATKKQQIQLSFQF